MQAPEVVHVETLLRTDAYTVERRQIKLDADEIITRDVIDDSGSFVVVVIVDEYGRPCFFRQLHPANAVYYWGFPYAHVPRTTPEQYLAIASNLVMSCFNGAAEIGEITYLVELFEDAVTMIDRRVRYYLAQLSRSPDSTNGQWWSAPHSHAVSRFTSDLRTDSLTLAGLLWIDTFPQRPDTDRGTDPDLDPALPIGPQLLDREVLFKGRWFSIVARSFAMESSIRPDEIVRDRQIVRRADTVLVLPVQGQRAITLREYIAGVNGHPPGLVGGHAQQGLAAPMVTAVAHREMREECGMSGRLVRLASTYGSPDLTRTVHHFLATRLFHDPLDTGAEDHDVRARWDELGDLVPGKLLNDFVVSEVATVLLAARELSGH